MASVTTIPPAPVTMVDEYFDYHIQYEKKYGTNLVVLYENGSFYELYGIDNEKEKITNIGKVSELLNIQLTRKNKSILENSRKNPLLAGIPSHAIQKYLPILQNNDYTVVFVEQITTPPNPKRAVTKVVSPSTNIDTSSNEVNHLLMFYISCEYRYAKSSVYCGVSVADISTGWNAMYEVPYSYDQDQIIDEIQRIISMYSPRELIFHVSYPTAEKETMDTDKSPANTPPSFDFARKEYIKKQFTPNHAHSLHTHFNEIPKEYYKISYQNEILRKVFPKTGMISPIEFIDSERMEYSRIAYVSLLDFIKQHNEILIKKIWKPEILDISESFSLETNAVQQLQVYSDVKSQTLFHIIDFTQTMMGKRLLRSRLASPTTNETVLNLRYNAIQYFIDHREIHSYIQKQLKNVVDVERAHRKIALGLLNPCDFPALHTVYAIFQDIITIYPEIAQFIGWVGERDMKSLNDFKEYYQNTFDVAEMGKYLLNDIHGSFFVKGKYPHIEEIDRKIRREHAALQAFAKKCSELIDSEKQDSQIKLDSTEKDGHYLVCTVKRSTLFKERIQNALYPVWKIQVNGEIVELPTKDFKYKIVGNDCKISSKTIDDCSARMISNIQKIKEICRVQYIEVLIDMYERFEDCMKSISSKLSELDFLAAGATAAIKHAYCRPIISNNDTAADPEKSFVDCVEIRHPIIERLSQCVEYTTNDISLGKMDSADGLLIFGINAVGKSSLMKAIGLNIIMAQIGYYTACKSFVYKPYKKIFTRISGEDNLVKGLSTFAVEMTELRTILNRSDKNSIVLGDEICHGTEQISGQSIVAASIIYLAERGVSFLFATHLHSISTMPSIQELKNVRMIHLEVSIESYVENGIEKSRIVYNRKIKDGPGGNMYGLEVAECIIHNDRFVSLAQKIRRDILEEPHRVFEGKQSNYSSEMYVEKCEICGKKAEDTHHIQFQCTANQDSMIGTIHKHTVSNLVGLCKRCHMNVHHYINGTKYIINGWEMTSEGRRLKYTVQKKCD